MEIIFGLSIPIAIFGLVHLFLSLSQKKKDENPGIVDIIKAAADSDIRGEVTVLKCVFRSYGSNFGPGIQSNTAFFTVELEVKVPGRASYVIDSVEAGDPEYRDFYVPVRFKELVKKGAVLPVRVHPDDPFALAPDIELLDELLAKIQE